MKTQKIFYYRADYAAKLMDVPLETLKKSVWVRPFDGALWVSARSVCFWNGIELTDKYRRIAMLPRDEFNKYMTQWLNDRNEYELNVFLDCYNVLKRETERHKQLSAL